MGIANANVAKMVIEDINAKGGLLGRRVDLRLEDSATTDSVAEAKATTLVEHDRVDVIFGDIYSSTQEAINGPAVVRSKKLYIYLEQYEGQECDPLTFCTGPVLEEAGPIRAPTSSEREPRSTERKRLKSDLLTVASAACSRIAVAAIMQSARERLRRPESLKSCAARSATSSSNATRTVTKRATAAITSGSTGPQRNSAHAIELTPIGSFAASQRRGCRS